MLCHSTRAAGRDAVLGGSTHNWPPSTSGALTSQLAKITTLLVTTSSEPDILRKGLSRFSLRDNWSETYAGRPGLTLTDIRERIPVLNQENVKRAEIMQKCTHTNRLMAPLHYLSLSYIVLEAVRPDTLAFEPV